MAEAARLRAGDQVRGVIGPHYTDAVSVPNPGEQLPIVVSASLLAKVENRGTLRWGYSVNRNGNWQDSDTIEILVVPGPPLFEDFNRYPNPATALFAGDSLDTPAFLIQVISGTLLLGYESERFRGIMYTVSASIVNVSLLLKRDITAFDCRCFNGTSVSNIFFYDDRDNLIATLPLPGEVGSWTPFSYRSPGPVIRRIEIQKPVDQNYILDDFKFTP